ncbi:SCO-spondin [Plutella xylostella]|uniref:SCO-spondin n=1 Tax=Plutella xylostella TaxID=51655 RepID=UPI0020328E2A|nr:SCO-spondin [Plutella xylostella]
MAEQQRNWLWICSVVLFLLNYVFSTSVYQPPPPVDQHGCTANQVYVNCAFNCPTDYCPRSDGPVPQCSPPYPCQPGCRCKVNHRIHPDGQCRRSDLCPPIRCTRFNEVYNSCTDVCTRESCADRNNTSQCNTLLLNCEPRCACRKGTWRNRYGICVPANRCT